MKKTYIIDAKRSAIGKFLGSLYESDIADVSSQVIKKGFSQNLLSDVDMVIIGQVFSAGTGQALARKIAISSGLSQLVPAYMVNMVCGSGMQAIRNGKMEIDNGSDLILCGGVELMSNIPFATDSYIRLGKKYGDFKMIDLMTHDGLIDSFSGVHMGITGENIARKFNISRQMQDAYSYLTQQRAIKAIDAGLFKDEIVPVDLVDYRNNPYVFDTDEFPNRESSPEKLASLKTTFIKDGTGTITAGSSSGINDGVAFVLLGSEDYCKKNNIIPMTELVDSVIVGCDPQLMGLGPYYAITALLDKTGLDFTDINRFEINEAYAAPTLGCFKLLEDQYGVNEEYIIERTNIYGSGLGLGHPLGATGARITTTLSHMMAKDKSLEYGISSLCIGGGMGAALLLKKAETI